MQTIFINAENSKVNKLHKSVLDLSQRLLLKTYLFITGGKKKQENSIITINRK